MRWLVTAPTNRVDCCTLMFDSRCVLPASAPQLFPIPHSSYRPARAKESSENAAAGRLNGNSN
jgi:hypothetical protein